MLLAIFPAGAAVDLAEARGMMVALRPMVERAAGRRFDLLPSLEIATREEVASRLAAQRAVLARLVVEPAEAPGWLERTAARDLGLLEHAAAVYSRLDDTIYLVKDNLEADLAVAPPGLLRRSSAASCGRSPFSMRSMTSRSAAALQGSFASSSSCVLTRGVYGP
jgi:hypothetical protein